MAESLTIRSIDDRWSQIKAEQGFLGKAWNSFKEVTNLGLSQSDCESMLEAYRKHEITLEEAMEYIEEFEKKQSGATDLIANIATGIGSIALATVSGGTSIFWLQAVKFGAPIGAAIKSVLKGLDRATNGIKGDTLDGKQIAKDVISGAVTGTTSAVSSKVYKGVAEASLKTSVRNGAICGLKCGALSGASSYLTDTALDDDKKFIFKDFAKNTLTSSAVSGSVGAIVGAGVFGAEKHLQHLGKSFALASEADEGKDTIIMSAKKFIARDSLLSSSRKVLGKAEKEVMNI